MNLTEVLKEAEKISGRSSIMEGVELKDVARIPFPAAGLTRMLYGGIPKGRMVEFSGAEASGKTSTSFLLASAYQKQDDRPVFYIDAEGTYDARWAAKLGVDNSKGRFIKWAPESATAEEVFEIVLQVAETGECGLIILDSIPVLIPQQEDAKSMSEYHMGGISKPLTTFARKMQKILLKRSNVTVIGINQVRDNMTGYGPSTVTPGGKAWKHLCSIRLEFKSELIDEGGKALPERSENPTGVRINVALKKNKTAPRDRKLAYYLIDFTEGFSERLDVIGIAIDSGIIGRSGSSYSYIDRESGEVLFKAQGRAKFVQELPEEIYEKIREDIIGGN